MSQPSVIERTLPNGGKDRLRLQQPASQRTNPPGGPVRAAKPELDPKAGARAAFRRIAADCLAQLQANRAGAIGTDDPEYIHQMRVATRRLRAALRLFAPVLPAESFAALRPQWRSLMATLGRARDLQVINAEIVRPVVAAQPRRPGLVELAQRIEARLDSARRACVLALRRPAYAELVRTANDLYLAAPSRRRAAGQTLARFADRRLAKLRRRVLRLADAARRDDPDSLHALRIGVKRLRYALEFFASLLPRRRQEALLDELVRLQDSLGQLHDLSNAGIELTACAAGDARREAALRLIGAWQRPRYAALQADVGLRLRRLRRLHLPRPR